jgi:hypothetical protein
MSVFVNGSLYIFVAVINFAFAVYFRRKNEYGWMKYIIAIGVVSVLAAILTWTGVIE